MDPIEPGNEWAATLARMNASDDMDPGPSQLVRRSHSGAFQHPLQLAEKVRPTDLPVLQDIKNHCPFAFILEQHIFAELPWAARHIRVARRLDEVGIGGAFPQATSAVT